VKGNISRISIWRAGTQQTLSVTIDLQPVNSPAKPLISNLQEKPHIDRRDLGLTLAPLPDDVRAKLSMPAQGAGVLVEGVAPNSVASDRGVTAGSVIVKVERQSVTSPGEVLRSIEDARQSNRAFVMLLIANTQGLRWTPLPL
jgi:serine protease Do